MKSYFVWWLRSLIRPLSFVIGLGVLGFISLLGLPKPSTEMPRHCLFGAARRAPAFLCDASLALGAKRLLDGQKIAINQATLRDLLQIPRLSRKTAKAILERRNYLGRFSHFQELLQVKGVGEKTLVKLKQYLVIEAR